MKNALPILPFGTQYYRPNTPRPDSWERDLENIRKKGFNTVKLMIPWRWCNPAEDSFCFDDFDRLMDLCQKNGLHVILNPVYSAPVWLLRKYPESLIVTGDGRIMYPSAGPGASYGWANICLHHKEGFAYRMRFIRELVGHFCDHPALMCWDMANEPELGGPREESYGNLTCYCAESEVEFKLWLQEKYGDIEKLNELWVRRYMSFEEVELPRGGGAYTDMIDWRLFMAETLTKECHARIRAAREMDSVHPMMVHDVTLPIFPLATCGNDDTAIAEACDLFGNSIGSEPLAAAITLSAAPGKMVINSEIHAVGGSTYDRPKLNNIEDMKRHIFVPLSAGIKGFVFWQYRPERLGLESPAWGLTDLAGNDTPWLIATEKIARAVLDNADVILDHAPHAQVGVINSQKGQLFDFCVRPGAQWYIKSVKGAHAMLRAAGYAVDIVSEQQITPEFLSRYKVLYDPFPYYKDSASCQVLKDWVANGGTLIAESCFGGYSADDGLHTIEQPGFGFAEVFGAKEYRVTTVSAFHNAYGNWQGDTDQDLLPIIKDGKTYQGFHFYQALMPEGGKTVASFEDGTAAIVANSYGKGTGIWIGSLAACPYEDGHLENLQLISDLVRTYSDALPELTTDRLHTVVSALVSENGQLFVVDNSSETDNVKIQAQRIAVCGDTLVNILTGEEIAICTEDGLPTAVLPVKAGCIEAYRVK